MNKLIHSLGRCALALFIGLFLTFCEKMLNAFNGNKIIFVIIVLLEIAYWFLLYWIIDKACDKESAD